MKYEIYSPRNGDLLTLLGVSAADAQHSYSPARCRPTQNPASTFRSFVTNALARTLCLVISH